MDYMANMRKAFDLDPALIKRIEDFQFDNRLKSEADAVRKLLTDALDAVDRAKANRNDR